MSGKSKSSKLDPARPFDAELWKKASEIASRYRVVIWFEDGEYYGHGVELPTTFSDGATPDQCMANLREAMTLTVAVTLEHGEAPPAPATEGRRTQQVNIRLSDEERIVMDAVAKSRGFVGIADYLRAIGLAGGDRSAARAKSA